MPECFHKTGLFALSQQAGVTLKRTTDGLGETLLYCRNTPDSFPPNTRAKHAKNLLASAAITWVTFARRLLIESLALCVQI